MKNPLVELGGPLADGRREPCRELVGHAGVERREGLAGEVPLVEEEERRASRLPPPGRHQRAVSAGKRPSISSRKLVE